MSTDAAHETAIRLLARSDADTLANQQPSTLDAFEVCLDRSEDEPPIAAEFAIQALGLELAADVYEDEWSKIIVEAGRCQRCGLVLASDGTCVDADEHGTLSDDAVRDVRRRQAIPKVIADEVPTRAIRPPIASTAVTLVAPARQFPTVDDGTLLASALYDMLVDTYERAIELTRHALAQQGREPDAGAIDAVRAQMFHHAMQMGAALGGGFASDTIGGECAELATAMAHLHVAR